MKLPFSLPFFGKEQKKEYFLALLLQEEKVTAVIFEEFLGKILIVGEDNEYFSDSIDRISQDEFLEVLDKTISTAENALPENIETQKTIFGVKENWIIDSKIKKEYLIKLKKVSDTLGLLPIGFLVINEAIAHLMQQEEGAPVSAILVEVGKKEITVSLIRAGRIVETKNAEIENSIPETTDKILHHFTNYEVLPSRIVIFDDVNSEKLTQAFIGYSWSKNLPFLHVPQTTILPKDFAAKAIVSGAATQMGFEVLDKEPVAAEVQKFSASEKLSDSARPQTPELSDGGRVVARELTEFQKDEKEVLEALEGGFEKKETQEEPEVSDFGFLKEEDIAKIEDEEKKKKEKQIDQKELLEEEATKKSVVLEKEESLLTKLFLSFKEIGSSLVSFFKPFSSLNIFSEFKSFDFSPFFKGGKVVFLVPFIFVLIIVVFISYFSFLRATVTISVKPKIIEQKQKITFSVSSKTDLAKNNIQVETISVTKEGSLSMPVTGKKEIGEKAKGTVVIYNSSLTEGRNLPKGTIITSSNSLQFTLDEPVKIASAAGDASAITSSTAKTSVTAKEIGKESNLPSGTKFTVENLSLSIIIAKNDSAFGGGTKKEITAVSKDDLNKLLTELPKNLEAKAKEEIVKKTPEDKILLPIFVKTSIDKKTFDKELGDEAKTLNLTATVTYQSLVYKRGDVDELISRILSKTTSDNLTFSKEQIKNDILEINKKGENDLSATFSLKASLFPKIDQTKLAEELAGKSFEEAKDMVTKLPQVTNTQISLSPNLPFLPSLLPRLSKNIAIILDTNE